jgi:CRISPR/Cas system CMR subunit Cmr6 (Cas7 group RAMP superfamily)
MNFEIFQIFAKWQDKIEDEIKKCSVSKRKRPKWMAEHLTPLYRKLIPEEVGWYWRFLCQATHFYHYKAANDDQEQEDIRAVYRGIVHLDRSNFFQVPEKTTSQLRILGIIFDPAKLKGLYRWASLVHFTFILAKPYLSQNDESFYTIDNPVRKEKIFKVPTVASSSWKGKLRWIATKLLVDQVDTLSDEVFAQRRLRLTLLFGDEKGEELGEVKALAKHLDNVRPRAKELYRRRVKEYFEVDLDKSLPHHAGRVYLYPTFFDCIDLEVINPHDRETKTGRMPIYLESVPIGAEGTFSLLYSPFDLIGKMEDHRLEVAEDLETVAEAVQAIMLTYGFGAKTTSGFGGAEDTLVGKGILTVEGKTYYFDRLSQLLTIAKRASSDLRRGGI